jgi:hypothetical protein
MSETAGCLDFTSSSRALSFSLVASANADRGSVVARASASSRG